VNVRPFLVAHAQPPQLIQRSKGPFDHPAPSAQPAAMFRVPLPQKRDDASVTILCKSMGWIRQSRTVRLVGAGFRMSKPRSGLPVGISTCLLAVTTATVGQVLK